MISISTRTRNFAAGVFAASVLALAAPTAASAGGYHHHHHGYYGGGYAAAGFGGGLLLGALAASAASEREVVYERSCWVERRRLYDAAGYPFYRRVRVCE
ncbi:hypothetical protein [Hansschlegelia sp.]|uniref:hypothetical protein n=1 Tax=Hansschlegelia sp. TaxID=2041892 RepID=UPI002CB2F2C7|nr:hypothetical protein [Hansschlegelia sp.]HVI28083.1 hypothetical protein [Hansschlegelia sp.]